MLMWLWSVLWNHTASIKGLQPSYQVSCLLDQQRTRQLTNFAGWQQCCESLQCFDAVKTVKGRMSGS